MFIADTKNTLKKTSFSHTEILTGGGTTRLPCTTCRGTETARAFKVAAGAGAGSQEGGAGNGPTPPLSHHSGFPFGKEQEIHKS